MQSVEDTIQTLTTKFLTSLSANLSKVSVNSGKNSGKGDNKTSDKLNEILRADISWQVIIHIISCTRYLKELYDDGVNTNNKSTNISNEKKVRNAVFAQCFQPILNGLLALMGKTLMDGFTVEPKMTSETAEISGQTVSAGSLITVANASLGRHILTQFPEMTTKRHKQSGKSLIHHVVFKAQPSIAEDIVLQILKVSPQSAQATDATGATPLHWATRNPELTLDVIDVLVKSFPDAPRIADNKGFLPLHWAVNQDVPSVEVVRKLIKLYPVAASCASSTGFLPLHYAVNRTRPIASVVKALITAYPESIRSGCEDGYLPIHRYVNRPILDIDILRMIVNYYPEGLTVRTNRGQAPLHVALDHHEPDPLTIELLTQLAPNVCSLEDNDKYMPLHLILDCAEPNYAIAKKLLMLNPAAAKAPTKDGMLPLHLVVGANSDPTHEHNKNRLVGNDEENIAEDFVQALLLANPEALVTVVKDIVPAIDGMALADPDSWSGEWVEVQWTPIQRAQERGLDGLVRLFTTFQRDVLKIDPRQVQLQPSHQAGAAISTINESNPKQVLVSSNLAIQPSSIAQLAYPLKSLPLYQNQSNYTGVNPMRQQFETSSNKVVFDPNIAPVPEVSLSSQSDQVYVPIQSARSANSGTAAPKVPPHILKAQLNAARSMSSASSVQSQEDAQSRHSSRDRGGGGGRLIQPWAINTAQNVDGGPSVITMESLDMQSVHTFVNPQGQTPNLRGSGYSLPQQSARPMSSMRQGSTSSINSASSGTNNRAPPPGPIPTSILQAAESNAIRNARVKSAGGTNQLSPIRVRAVSANLNTGANASGRSPVNAGTMERPMTTANPPNVGVSKVSSAAMAWSSGEDSDGVGGGSKDIIAAKQQRLLQAQQQYMKRMSRSAQAGASPSSGLDRSAQPAITMKPQIAGPNPTRVASAGGNAGLKVRVHPIHRSVNPATETIPEGSPPQRFSNNNNNADELV